MFRAMRRHRQALPPEECERILREGTSGVLALAGDDGYPYAVPLSYVYTDGALYFHCARQGHKLDAVRRCGKASFCVIAQDEILPEAYTTLYRSVIVFGRIRILTEAEMPAAIEQLALKYAPDDLPERRQAEIEREWNGLCMLCLQPEQITGKAGRELLRRREGRLP